MQVVRAEVAARHQLDGPAESDSIARSGLPSAAVSAGLLIPNAGHPGNSVVLARVNEELARSAAQSVPGGAAPAQDMSAPPMRDEFLLPRLALPPKTELEPRAVYTIADFVALHDASFIKSVYRICLGRQPDRAGLDHYLTALRGGRLGKIDILGRLRYSAEGRARGVSIPGLLPRYLGRLVFRVPVVGDLLRRVYSM